MPPQAGNPVILYFHGNGGALNYRVERFRRLIAAGIGLVALEYRGYGGLGGSPSEQGLIRDADAAYAFAAAHYPAQQIVLWGNRSAPEWRSRWRRKSRSAASSWRRRSPRRSPLRERRYWYLPVRLLMKDQFRSDERIKKVTAPLSDPARRA